MEKIFLLVEFLFSLLLLYVGIKYFLPESIKCFGKKECTEFTRGMKPKKVKGKRALKGGLIYIFLLLYFLILFLSKTFNIINLIFD
jgi:hypothetical protein